MRAVYEPGTPELGKNATGRRVAALRAMNGAGGPQFKRYERGNNASTYKVETVKGETRTLATREVAAYVISQLDAYDGLYEQFQEALQAALADPDVVDQESLLTKVMAGMEERCGDPLRKAAAYFSNDQAPSSAVSVVA